MERVIKLICLTAFVFINSGISQDNRRITGRITDTAGNLIGSRFYPPPGYFRLDLNTGDFGAWLRNRPLKPNGTLVKYYDGNKKSNPGIYEAVVDLPIGNKNLHQCADAVIRLRAEYLWEQGRFDEIHFNFTNGFRADYSEWMKGKRISVNGNKVWWEEKTTPSNTYDDFWNYLEVVFTYAGTLSLEKELKTVLVENMQPGDVFIHGGSPGHAVIVVDMAVNPETGKKLFMLAQSYMPAQEIQILANPENPDLSPWYELTFGDLLVTPEWQFTKGNLRRFDK